MADTRYSGISFSVSQALANFLFLHDPAYLYRACAHFCALRARSGLVGSKISWGSIFCAIILHGAGNSGPECEPSSLQVFVMTS